MPLVSVVIPSYNHAPFVKEAIASVLDQSIPDFEIVITDDGSTDGTVAAIREIQDSRIDLHVFKNNRGAAAALNASIERSRGEFICYLSSDDKFLPDKLEKQIDFLRENPDVAATFGIPRFIDERGSPLAEENQFNGAIFRAPLHENLRSSEDWLRRFFLRGNCLCHPTAMVRRTVYDEIGLFDPRFANLLDFDMWVRLCMRHEIHVSAAELTLMRIRDEGRNMSAPRIENIVRNNIEFFEILKHYKALTRSDVGRIFSQEIRESALENVQDSALLLAEIALKSPARFHMLFGLDTMFENISRATDADYLRLSQLAGSHDVFGFQLESELREAISYRKTANARIDDMQNALLRETEARKFLEDSIQFLEDSIHLAIQELSGLRRSKSSALLKMKEEHWQKIGRAIGILERKDS